MLKKSGILCLILSLALIAAVAGAEAALMSKSSFEAAGETENAPGSRLAEISYDYINSISITLRYKARIDTDALTKGLNETDKQRVQESASAALAAVSTLWTDLGYQVTSEDGTVTAVTEQYDSITDMYIAYGYNGYKTSSKLDTIWGPLYNVYVTRTATKFKGMDTDSPAARAANLLLNAEGIDEEDVAYVYNYGTRYSTDAVRSDAEKVYEDSSSGAVIHSFIMSADNLDREITIYQISPNTLTWYGAAVAVALAFAGLGAVTASRNKR